MYGESVSNQTFASWSVRVRGEGATREQSIFCIRSAKVGLKTYRFHMSRLCCENRQAQGVGHVDPCRTFHRERILV